MNVTAAQTITKVIAAPITAPILALDIENSVTKMTQVDSSSIMNLDRLFKIANL